MAFLVYEINMLKGAMDGCKDFLHYDMIGGRYKGVNFADYLTHFFSGKEM